MPKFVMLSTLGPDGARTLRENPQRLRAVNGEVESMGGKVLHQWAVLGEWDFVNVIETPDELTMAKIATALSARGTLKTRCMTAIDTDEFIEAMGEGV